MENITASEVAGFGVGTLLLCATIVAPKIDSLISSSQRISLGMCKRCGDLKMIACAKCKGSGLIKEGLVFGINFANDTAELKSSACANCRGRGHFSCPECPKSSLS